MHDLEQNMWFDALDQCCYAWLQSHILLHPLHMRGLFYLCTERTLLLTSRLLCICYCCLATRDSAQLRLSLTANHSCVHTSPSWSTVNFPAGVLLHAQCWLLLLQADWQAASPDKPELLLRATSGPGHPQRGISDASALISHFDDWARVLDNEAESSLSRRGSGKLEGLEPDALRSTVDGLLKRQPGPSKLQPHAAPHPVVCHVLSLLLLTECAIAALCHAST